MKTQTYAIPNALAVTTVIVYAACRLLVSLFPDASFAIAQSWFHGIELGKLGAWDFTFGSFILGIISSAVTAWVVGYIFIKVYRLFNK